MNKIRQNSHVLFYYNHTKKWLLKISKNDSFHTHIGVIRHSDAIGKEYGSRLVTSKDKYVYLFKPTMYDYTMKIQHGTQIVYPKDIGYIISRAGIQSGQKVVEIGTGSGSLTSFVASVVKPRGHVYTFDVNTNFIKIATKNIMRAGMSKYVTLYNMNLKNVEDPPVEDADVVLIDLGDPWTVIPQVRKILKGSGSVFAVCPTINQLENLSMALAKNEFSDIESTEQIVRTIEAREGKSRHSFQAIGHTTYLCHARKAFFEMPSYSQPQAKKTVAISYTAKLKATTKPKPKATTKPKPKATTKPKTATKATAKLKATTKPKTATKATAKLKATTKPKPKATTKPKTATKATVKATKKTTSKRLSI